MQEYTKERQTPDGTPTTMKQELKKCIDEIKNALSDNSPTEPHPGTLDRKNRNYYDMLRPTQVAYYESSYGNDDKILTGLQNLQDWLDHFEETQDYNNHLWESFTNSYHMGINAWNGHRYLKLTTYPWREGNHEDFYKEPRQRVFLTQFVKFFERTETLASKDFLKKFSDMRDNEWYAILDQKEKSILEKAKETYERKLERERKEEEKRRTAEERQRIQGEQKRYRYVAKTFDISTPHNIVMALDIVLPIYTGHPHDYKKPVLFSLLDELQKSFSDRITTDEDDIFWASLIQENMNIKDILKFDNLPVKTQAEGRNLLSADEVKKAMIGRYITPKITKMIEIIDEDIEPETVLALYGLEPSKASAPAA